MKILLILILVLCNHIFFAQTKENEEVFWDLANSGKYSETRSELGYVNIVPKGMFNYSVKQFENHKSKIYRIPKEKGTDKIRLTRKEKTHILSELKMAENFEWNLKDNQNLKLVSNDDWEIYKYLKADRNREVKIISKPIFIRGSSICVVYHAHLCCGEIMGHTELSFYKKINGKWKNWIPITQGDF